MDYMTIAEASKEWGISHRRIQILCAADRIPGTQRFGTAWMIPRGTEKPADARIKSGKYIKTSRTENKTPSGND